MFLVPNTLRTQVATNEASLLSSTKLAPTLFVSLYQSLFWPPWCFPTLSNSNSDVTQQLSNINSKSSSYTWRLCVMLNADPTCTAARTEIITGSSWHLCVCVSAFVCWTSVLRQSVFCFGGTLILQELSFFLSPISDFGDNFMGITHITLIARL